MAKTWNSPIGSSETPSYLSHESHDYSSQTSDWDVSLGSIPMVSYGSARSNYVSYEMHGAVAFASGEGEMEQHISRSMNKVQSKDLKSGCLIGKGPSSIVYETTSEGKNYARKDFLRVPSYIFEREATALIGLDHPNVLQTYGWTVDEGSCSLVVELMDSDLLNLMQKIKDSRQKQSSSSNSASQMTHLIDLRMFITDNKNAPTGIVSEPVVAPLVYPFELPEALHIMVQVAEGVKFMHDKGVAHGDLKPTNILVKSNGKVSSSSLDENLAFKVADFGLFWTKMKSRTLVSRQTSNLKMAQWRAPELFELIRLREDEHESSTDSDWDSDSSDETIDELLQKFTFKDLAMADVYNFALTCSQILSGEDPFPELSLSDLVGRILGGLRPRLPPTCPTQLRDLLKKCWGEKTKRPSFEGISCELKDLQALLTRSDTMVNYKSSVTESSSSRIDKTIELEFIPEHNVASGQFSGGPESSSAQEIHPIVDVPIGHEEHPIKDIQDNLKGTLGFNQRRSGKALGCSNFIQKMMSMSNVKKDRKAISSPTKFYGDKLKRKHPNFGVLHYQRFSSSDIKRMTNNFSAEDIIRREGRYTVYKGILASTGSTVAILRLQKVLEGTFEAYKLEMEMMSHVYFKYVVALVGYGPKHDPILIYEYPDNGSLFDHLHGTSRGGSTLNWRMRLHIALNAAQGLDCLHTWCSPSIIHRNVKSSNILLTPEFDAKVADFELAKLMSETEDMRVMTDVVGTKGYLDPEYFTTYCVSTKSDVYSFGIVLLELITGSLPIDLSMLTAGRNPSIVHWVQERLKLDNNIDSILAPSVKTSNHNMKAIWKVVELAMRSVEPKATHRPTMSEVVQELQDAWAIEIGQIVRLP